MWAAAQQTSAYKVHFPAGQRSPNFISELCVLKYQLNSQFASRMLMMLKQYEVSLYLHALLQRFHSAIYDSSQVVGIQE